MMTLVGIAVLAGILTIGAAALYVWIPTGSTDTTPRSAQVFLEAFKVLGGFTLLTAGGALAKYVVDQTLEQKKQERSEQEANERARTELINEFAAIYSEFYSLRKLYHSAIGRKTLYMSSAELDELKKDILKAAVDLEGRYGGLKVRAITHFDLRRGQLGYKHKDHLLKELAAMQDEREATRLRFDLLGECYDDWRHAVEEGRENQPGRGPLPELRNTARTHGETPSQAHNPAAPADGWRRTLSRHSVLRPRRHTA